MQSGINRENKERKKMLADRRLIKCARCRYHRGENATRRKRRKRNRVREDRTTIRHYSE